jgi:hypothetical protein
MKLFDIRKKHGLPTDETALPGRDEVMSVPEPLDQRRYTLGSLKERLAW